MSVASAADGFRATSLLSFSDRTPPPLGERIRLPGRGRIFFRQSGRPGATPVVLLHGWIASGGLNWFQAFEPLRSEFHVIAPDLRGHGRGIRSLRGFRLEDCADDVALLLDALETGPAIIVGYSMGGPIAQLLWRRHRDLVSGLVLCATSAAPVAHRGDQIGAFRSFMGGAATTTSIADWSTWGPRKLALSLLPQRQRPGSLSSWARAEFRRHHWPTLLDAGRAISDFDGRRWIGEVDVPTVVLVTARDRAIPQRQQLHTAQRIEGATVHRIDDGHLACIRPSFGHAVREACLDVSSRTR